MFSEVFFVISFKVAIDTKIFWGFLGFFGVLLLPFSLKVVYKKIKKK
jgi:hypothetical protein